MTETETRRAALDAALFEARTCGDRTPCSLAPRAFDAGESSRAEVLALAMIACRHRCPVLAQCRAWAESGPAAAGVIGGQYVLAARHDGRTPTRGLAIRAAEALAERYARRAAASPVYASLPLGKALRMIRPRHGSLSAGSLSQGVA